MSVVKSFLDSPVLFFHAPLYQTTNYLFVGADPLQVANWIDTNSRINRLVVPFFALLGGVLGGVISDANGFQFVDSLKTASAAAFGGGLLGQMIGNERAIFLSTNQQEKNSMTSMQCRSIVLLANSSLVLGGALISFAVANS